MATTRALTPGEEVQYKVALRTKGWFPINARFETKCEKCGADVKPGDQIAWNKGRAKVMHLNPCAFDWMDVNTKTEVEEKPPEIGGVFGKKAAPQTSTTPAPAAQGKETTNEPAKRKPYFLAGKLK